MRLYGEAKVLSASFPTNTRVHAICHVSAFYYIDLLNASLALGKYLHLSGEDTEIQKVRGVDQDTELVRDRAHLRSQLQGAGSFHADTLTQSKSLLCL